MKDYCAEKILICGKLSAVQNYQQKMRKRHVMCEVTN